MNKRLLIVAFGILVIGFLFFINSEPVEENYVLLEFQYDNGEISLLSKSLEIGKHPKILHEVENEYQINLISNENINLYSDIFDPTKLFSDSGDNEIEGGVIVLDEAIFYIAVPDYDEAEKIEIYNKEDKIFEEGIYDVGAESCRIK